MDELKLGDVLIGNGLLPMIYLGEGIEKGTIEALIPYQDRGRITKRWSVTSSQKFAFNILDLLREAHYKEAKP